MGALTFLNVPNIPFQHDTIVTFRFVNDPGPECIGDTCAAPCTDDSQCRDIDPCNGEEFCHLGNCHAGVAVSCDDGNECNGTEACAAQDQGGFRRAMCVPGPDLNCNDGNTCNFDQCRADFLCVHPANPAMNDKPCDDHNLCTGQDTDPATRRVRARPAALRHLQQRRVHGIAERRGGGAPLQQRQQSLRRHRGVRPDDGQQLHDGYRPWGPRPRSSASRTPTPARSTAATRSTCAIRPPRSSPGPRSPATTATSAPPRTTCQSRRCIGDLSPAAATCNVGDGNICTGVEACNPLTGACEFTPLDCNDGNVCTDRHRCDPERADVAGACVYINNTDPCDDTNACTDVAAASAGGASESCRSRHNCNAGDGDVCNGIEHCNATGGVRRHAPEL